MHPCLFDPTLAALSSYKLYPSSQLHLGCEGQGVALCPRFPTTGWACSFAFALPFHLGSRSLETRAVIWGFTKIRDPEYRLQLVGFPI